MNPKNQSSHGTRKERDKEKDGRHGQRQQGVNQEDSKVADDGQAQNELHGPSRHIFINSQTIPKKESLVPMHGTLFKRPHRNISESNNAPTNNLLPALTQKKQEPVKPKIIKPKKEEVQDDNFISTIQSHKEKEQKQKLKSESYIKTENFMKLNYSDLDDTKNGLYALMNGKYSSLRQGIAYINPKANEPHELIEGRPPRKVMIDRMKKVYATINIETLLKQVNIDFSKLDPLESWLPLEFFEDKDLDIFTAEEWIAKANDPEKGQLYIEGVGLHRDKDGTGTWKKVLINAYDPKKEKYLGVWDDKPDGQEKEPCELSKIYLLFDAENPFLFCKKVSLASAEREKAESIIRYNLYIDRMLTENLPDINDDIRKRLLNNIKKLSFLKVEQGAIDDLMRDLNNNYMRTTNKIIFDKFYYSNYSNLLIIDNLKLPPRIINNPDINVTEVREKGLEPIPQYNYITSYKEFTFKTLLCKKEIIECLQKIKEECNKIKNNNCIFSFDVTRPLRLQGFKSKQKFSITNMKRKLDDWVKVIKDTLEKSLAGVGKGSFNLNVASKEIYEYLKLKKYMTVVKCIMQDVLYNLITKSVAGYVEFFKKYIPESVEVKDVNCVINHFADEEEKDELNTTNDLISEDKLEETEVKGAGDGPGDEDDYLFKLEDHPALFQINLNKKDEKTMEYTTKEEDLIKDIQQIFDLGVQELQDISQVEPLLLPNLIKAAKNHIPLKTINRPKGGKPKKMEYEDINKGFELNDDAIWIWDQYLTLEKYLKKACEPLKPYLETFKKYKDYMDLNQNQRLKEIRDDEMKDPDDRVWTVQKIKEDIIKNKQIEEQLLKEIPKIIHVSFFMINCKEFRNELATKFKRIAESEIDLIKEKARALNGIVLNGYEEIINDIKAPVEDIKDLKAVQDVIKSLPMKIQKLKEQTQSVDELYAILDGFKEKLDYMQFESRMQLLGKPTEIENLKKDKTVQLEKKMEILAEQQVNAINELKDNIASLSTNIKELAKFNQENQLERAKPLADYIKTTLIEYKKMGIDFNEKETLFKKPRTDWSLIGELDNELMPYYNLWVGMDMWKNRSNDWLEGEFSKLDGAEVDTTLTDLTKNFNAALSRFSENKVDESIFNLCLKYKKQVDEFKPKGELAVALTRGLKDRHWKEIKDKTGVDCTPREKFHFSDIINAGMINHLEFCNDVGEKAYREAKIEEQLTSLDKKWKDIFFNLQEHKTTKIPTITNWNDINKELDQNLMDVQQLELSPYKGPFAESIAKWNKELLKISNILEEWNKCQKSWIYLQPVFDASDIAKEIPYEHKKFKMTDRMWQELMNGLNNNRNVKTCCANESLLEKLREANMNLDNVEKGLNDYMEKKRAIFPRFYFISNAQFLEILSQTKDISKVQDNVNKIFEPIDSIELVEENKYIASYASRFGERLKFDSNLLIFGENVEKWMSNLESKMFKSVRAYMEASIKDYYEKERHVWVKFHPGQIVMAVNQIMWTKEVEKSLTTNTLSEFIKTYNQRISDIVDLVREESKRPLSITLANLITLDVHNQLIMNTLLSEGINDIKAFKWIMNLRYYWELNSLGVENCMVKSVQTDFPYGYEYVGNAEILVITPLTDKCNLTLMGALRLNLGGAPAGPAGTGKTETTKDLARTLGKLCIVYNCSDDTDYVMIGKFFKGLACCGAWICFDEFNRINIEVLSVIAQQLLTLFGAKDRNQTEIIFEGSAIVIKPTFCVFITMNPGYAGRTELPDNLKALFRSISMMVPDYRLIAEINLYSSGYQSATSLATKVVSTMKLSSEQLSSQGHYDFGMRAVKSVLNAARRLKRTERDTREDQLLLRALEDVNVPKFLEEDIKLFRNIIRDLFPTTERPPIDYGDLVSTCEKVCYESKFNLIPTESFKAKIIQLYDTIQVRHGLMIVGPAGGGKTSNYNVLKEAMTRLADGTPTCQFLRTHTNIINPKAVTHGELYSEQNVDTGDWILGIVPLIINECKKDTGKMDKYWIIFDGPVDAMWIEDMNSVLDDSKKLCLASSDIILLNDYITIMFEVEDLIVASPATVSRCGMVYMEPHSLGIKPLYECWIKKLIEMLETLAANNAQNAQGKEQKEEGKKKDKKDKGNPRDRIKTKLKTLFDTYCEDMIEFVRKKVKEPCPTVNNNLAYSCMRIIDTFFDQFRTQEAQFKNMDAEVNKIDQDLEGIFFFALIWSMGVTTNEQGRDKFNKYFKEFTGKKALNEKFKVPDEGTVYDYLFDSEKGEWVKWVDIIGKLDVSPNADYTEIIVPTTDSVRNSFIIKQLVSSNKHIITTGPTGTGKTVNIMEVLTKSLGEKYMAITMNFSAQTTARQTQDTVQGKLQRRGRGRYAPEKPATIFIDDLNMPVKQSSGAQPPIEILRQWMDHSGWYLLSTKSFITVENIIFLGAMGLPGGGKNYLSQRFQRHFNLITYNELDDISVTMIFSAILKHFLIKFPDEIKNAIDDTIAVTLRNYKDIKGYMLPTPAKMHYIFNLRDISKVLQGVSSATLEETNTRLDVARIWVHEMTRVFGDRLINNEDRGWLRNKLNEESKKVYGPDDDKFIDKLYEFGKTIVYCDFMGASEYAKRNYILVQKESEFIKKINGRLASYNENSKKKLNLVMFLDACDHVSRICRILRQPRGNALLLGVGGSGRQSLARLATYINSYECFQIDVIKGYGMKDFANDVKICLLKSGTKNANQTFLMVDTQIVYGEMLEYINGILNTGDVPNLYEKQMDKDQITTAVKDEVMTLYGNMMESNVMKVYLERVQKHIHVVLAMSPLGGTFISRLRMFPALVNCCTLDWFSEWPEDALQSVAMEALNNSEKITFKNEEKPMIVESCKYIHKRVEIESKVFSEQMKRFVYLTPTSYLELLNLYQSIYKMKYDEYHQDINRYENGLKILESANVEVDKLRKTIEERQPILEKAKADASVLLEAIKKESAEANIQKEKAAKTAEEANKLNQECTEILEQSNKEFDLVKPLIQKAMNAIQAIKESDLREVANLKKFSVPCQLLMEAVLLFLIGTKFQKKEYAEKDPSTGKFVKWKLLECLKLIDFSNVAGFKEKLQDFCGPKLEELKSGEMLEHIELVNKHFAENNVTREMVKKGAESICGLFDYLLLLAEYVKNAIEKIDPIKKKLEKAKAEKAVADEALADAERKSREAQAKVDKLNAEKAETMAKMEKLEREVNEANMKMTRARTLISLLAGEQSRWINLVAQLKVEVENLSGDALMAAASICYNGPFIHSYRQKLENDWRDKIKDLNLRHSEGISMKKLLEDPNTINEWKLCGLPSDDLSIENGIIIAQTRRWPLLIDPQNQGSNYIKKYGKKIDMLHVVKASDPNFLNQIKGALRGEKWILLENVGTNLDPTLEPILNQSYVKKGTSYEITIGDEQPIPWSFKFKLMLSTTIPNPHYSPETFVKVTIVNFGITPTGLQEQMMTLLINNEMPELEQRKNAIAVENSESLALLKSYETQILNSLSSSGGNVEVFLENENLITTLKESKSKSEEISQKIEESRETTIKIDKEREKYRPAAERASILFFATLDLSSIDPMYQFSLQWFSKLYESSIKTAPNSSNKEVRIGHLNRVFTKNLYENVCRSLFEKDKLLFSFVICHKIITGERAPDTIPADQWRFFLAGPSGDVQIPQNPTDYINKNEWDSFYRQLNFMSENFEKLKGLEQYFMKKPKAFKPFYDDLSPQTAQFPEQWEEKVTEFLRLCMIKMLRPDKLIAAIQLWIEKNIGKEFIEPPPFELGKSYKQSSNIVPLIFILSPGSDPINDIRKFAEDQGYSKGKFETVSLGRGQEKKAMDVLEQMRTAGGWVLLQNCHLAKSFMGKLEEIVENFDTNWPDKDFRLWLTSMSNPFFPVSILQNSVKITVEPPKGLKNNVLRNYKKIEPKELEDDCIKRDEYKTLLFGLSFFHAIVQDRRKYGPIGWNVKYDFTNEDWMVSRKQIKIFLEEYNEIPYQVLDYLIGDINYGGRVTDDKDQRLIKTILKTYLCTDIFQYSKYKFSKSGTYYCPEPCEHDIYLTYIESFPVNSDPEVFGLHDNADIITAQNEGDSLLTTVLGIQPRMSSSSGKSQESIILDLILDIEKKIPDLFDQEGIFKKFPTDYNESLNTVLNQEVIRYNKLLNIIKSSIVTLQKGLTGKIVMDNDTEQMSQSIFNNQVPTAWGGVFLSLKPLSSWVIDLNQRIKFFRDWVEGGKTPSIFWFSGFSFPQAFLTAVLQNYARASKTAIDLLTFEYKILDKKKPADLTEKPDNGVYVYGMFLEGARWNYDRHLLDDSLPKELYTDVPVIHFIPVANRTPPTTGCYYCPLYKVLSRAGTLSTTGHSTNYILYVELPTDRPENVWIKAGVAMFLSLKQ